ncbi:tetratricopeptide repeat protein [Leptospira sp. GIMC2001]|uniref:tetratricopeptide repeat protein n=1 Tax=Leptospira sp. GIMC2001 TaxID=1513297 RepID=UPI00234AD050|nr:tetratricopeptide repeat protein [Leptospira sp. GIMC2001]WCL48162.1 tetratricopeptide repeat protein [Leptospira sp. GIMC2001]
MDQFLTLTKIAIDQEKSKDYTRAFNSFNKALAFTKDENTILKIRSRQAWCLHLVGNPDETQNIYEQLIESYPQNSWSYLLYARYLIKTKRFKAAKTLLAKASKVFQDNLEIYLTLASLLKDMERSNEAIDVLKLALAQETLTRGRGIRRKDMWAELGSLFFQRGDYNSAISALKKSLRMDTEDHFLHYDILGLCYLLVGDPENSVYFIDKYVQFNGEVDVELLVIKARAHTRLGANHLACASLLQAYSVDDRLILDADDMVDLAPLKQIGFLETLENLEIED